MKINSIKYFVSYILTITLLLSSLGYIGVYASNETIINEYLINETRSYAYMDEDLLSSSLAYNKTVTPAPDSIIFSGASPEGLVDGKISDTDDEYYRLNKSSFDENGWAWVQVDLGSEQAVDTFILNAGQALKKQVTSNIAAVKIEGSLDGTNYFDIIEETTYEYGGCFPFGAALTFIADEAVSARYIRLNYQYITSADDGNMSIIMITEFGVYNSASIPDTMDTKILIYSKFNETDQAAQPVILYVINHGNERVGTDSDEDIISDFLNEGYAVVVADFENNPEMVSPAIDEIIMDLRVQTKGNAVFGGTNVKSETNQIYIVPSGCRLKRDVVFFEIDKHGAYGSIEYIMDHYNSYIVENYGNAPVEKPEDMVKPDGTPIDYQLKMDIVYPSNPEQEVPVMMMQASVSPRNKAQANVVRPHYIGFLMRGYALVNYDHNYNPLYRADHYDQSSTKYGMDNWNGIAANTAAVRCVRAHAEEFGYSTEYIGAWGHSKGSYGPAILSERDHVGMSEWATFDGFEAGSPEPQPWDGYSSNIAASYYSMGDGTLRHESILTENHVPTIIACGENDPYDTWDYWPALKANFESKDIPHLALGMRNFGHNFPLGYDEELDIDRYNVCFEFFDHYLKPSKKLAPEVLYIKPFANETNVEHDSTVTVKFAPRMDADSVLKGLSIVKAGTTDVVKGTWTPSQENTTYVWSPEVELEPKTTYEIKLSSAMADQNGNLLGEDKVVSFETVGNIVTLEAAEDSQVCYGRASEGGSTKNTNFGDELELYIRNIQDSSSLINWNRKTYIKFSYNKLSAAKSAKLRVTTSGTPTGHTLDVYGLVDSDQLHNWDEDTITWTNAPANDTANTGLISSMVYNGRKLDSIVNSSSKEYEIDVTDYVKSLKGGNATFVFVAPNKASETNYILSKEGAEAEFETRNGPELILEFDENSLFINDGYEDVILEIRNNIVNVPVGLTVGELKDALYSKYGHVIYTDSSLTDEATNYDAIVNSRLTIKVSDSTGTDFAYYTTKVCVDEPAIVIYDAEDRVVDTLAEGKYVKADITTVSPDDISIILASYNKEDNSLIDVSIETADYASNDIVETTAKLALPDVGEYCIKLFVWQDINNSMTSVFETKSLDTSVNEVEYEEHYVINGTETAVSDATNVEGVWFDTTGNSAKKHFGYSFTSQADDDNNILNFALYRKKASDASNVMTRLWTPIDATLLDFLTDVNNYKVVLRVKPIAPTGTQTYDTAFNFGWRINGTGSSSRSAMGEFLRFRKDGKICCGGTGTQTLTDTLEVGEFNYGDWCTVTLDIDTSTVALDGSFKIVASILNEATGVVTESKEYTVSVDLSHPVINSFLLHEYGPQYIGAKNDTFGTYIDYIKVLKKI